MRIPLPRSLGSAKRLSTILLASWWWRTAAAAATCNPVNSRLDAFTHAFISDCNVTEWCSVSPSTNLPALPGAVAPGQAVLDLGDAATSGLATCVPRGCRTDEFPFGYPNNSTLPSMCPSYQYCPDQGDTCRDLVALSGACELNRDDECLPPSIELQMRLGNPSNFNGSMCLNLRCAYASAGEGEACEVDNTVYTGYIPDGSTYTDIITRDNCATTLYCDPTAFTCTPTLDLLSACSSDRECTSVNCSPQNVCAAPPATPLSPGTWAYALVGLALIGTMVGTVGMLLVIDRKQKVRRRRERAEAWNEQRELRAAILGLHRATGAGEGEMRRKWSLGSSEW